LTALSFREPKGIEPEPIEIVDYPPEPVLLAEEFGHRPDAVADPYLHPISVAHLAV
jgi:hypothetical protein